MQNLISKYKKLKSEMGPSGASPPTWPLFEKMAKIVGGYRSMNVEGVVEESFSCAIDVPDCDISCVFDTRVILGKRAAINVELRARAGNKTQLQRICRR
ncbi:uncharacterized protein LOC111591686 [Ceratitis capitata]|uniref:(Mediterranean fruit fly) hypothetical protein n=1 Tax=Ceratitis capitata TaxID=7213 RepID=A0A811V679_CERCA|nr:uncharacterized protein LOC111591686 [Ceratitis capitata]CAD7011405.1 unnamed protein product [Ceratitis capitata]